MLFIMYNYRTIYYNVLKLYHYTRYYFKPNNKCKPILYYRLADFKEYDNYLITEKKMLVRYTYKNKFVFLIYDRVLLPNEDLNYKIKTYTVRWPLIELIYKMKRIDVTNEMNMMCITDDFLFNNTLARILMFIKTNNSNELLNYKWNIMTPNIEIFSGTDIIINNKQKNI